MNAIQKKLSLKKAIILIAIIVITTSLIANLFVGYNVIWGQWQYTNQIYWGSAVITTVISHPLSASPEDSGINLDFYRFQGDDYKTEFPSASIQVMDEEFRFEYSTPHPSQDEEEYITFIDLSLSQKSWYRSILVSNKGGQLTALYCHWDYNDHKGGCETWTPSQGWQEYIQYE